MKVLTTQDCGYVARKNAVHAWTPDEERTTALLAFKIQFGDRVPGSAN